MRILVAEQDQALGTFLERSFDAENYHVDLAVDGEAAKAMAEAQEYDAAIFDLNVAAQEGMEILRHVRSGHESDSGALESHATGRAGAGARSGRGRSW